MDIAKIIEQRYPLRLFLPVIRQVRDLHLTFQHEAGSAFREGLYAILQKMNVNLWTEDYEDQRIDVVIQVYDKSLQMHCTGCLEKHFCIEDEDPVPAAAWTLYALATGQNWYKDDEYFISAKMFSLEQQLLAGSLLGALNFHCTAAMAPDTKEQIRSSIWDLVCRIADSFASRAPSLQAIPVPENGLTGIPRNFLGNVEDMKRIDLLRRLGCNDVEEDLRIFCTYAQSSHEYAAKMDRAVSQLLHDLRFQPMTDLENVLQYVLSAIESGITDRRDDKLRKLRQALEEKCKPRSLSASHFCKLFEDADTIYQELAKEVLRVQVFFDFSGLLLKKYRILYENSVRQVNQMRKQKSCYINYGAVVPQRLDWQGLDDSGQIQNFYVECDSWNDDGGARLADIVQNGYRIPNNYSELWLCGSECFRSLENLVFQKAREVPGLNKQLLVAYMMKGKGAGK